MKALTGRWLSVLNLLTLLVTAPSVFAQLPPNLPYDGRAILARVRFASVTDPAACLDPDGLGDGGWSHDYPMSVQGMMKAATEVTSLEAPVDSFVTLLVTDPAFMKYPLAMVTEPGCWNPSEEEVKVLRTYLEKGGFLLLDDPTFSDATIPHMELAVARAEAWLSRVLPQGKVVVIPATDPIFSGFFQLGDDAVPPPISTAVEHGTLRGIYRDNDPTKPLMVILTYQGVLGHHWRWVNGVGSGIGETSSPSGKAYRLGLNILVYGLSH